MNKLKPKIEALYADAESTYKVLSSRYGPHDEVALKFVEGTRDACREMLDVLEMEEFLRYIEELTSVCLPEPPVSFYKFLLFVCCALTISLGIWLACTFWGVFL